LANVYGFLQRMLQSPFGRALAGIRVNEQRLRSIGYPVFFYKLGVFALAGALAGAAGYLAACQFGFVNPDILAWHQSGMVLMMVILGGMGRLHGAVLGAIVYILLQEVFSSAALFGALAKHWQLAMGGLIVVIVRAAAWHRRLYRCLHAPPLARPSSPRSRARAMTEPILQVRQISKSFSGLAAVDRVSLNVEVGTLHAVIGPNGAGKTTLINLLSGDLPASSGTVLFDGLEISHRSPEQRSRLGIGRIYQRTNIFPTFTLLENCRLAAQSRQPQPLRWWKNVYANRDLVEQARRALESVGLGERADDLALNLSHGEQRPSQ
jgi:branched-chain amino acid transport system ATP-binding protein/branched-chain amino acid transport system permease protein